MEVLLGVENSKISERLFFIRNQIQKTEQYRTVIFNKNTNKLILRILLKDFVKKNDSIEISLRKSHDNIKFIENLQKNLSYTKNSLQRIKTLSEAELVQDLKRERVLSYFQMSKELLNKGKNQTNLMGNALFNNSQENNSITKINIQMVEVKTE